MRDACTVTLGALLKCQCSDTLPNHERNLVEHQTAYGTHLQSQNLQTQMWGPQCVDLIPENRQHRSADGTCGTLESSNSTSYGQPPLQFRVLLQNIGDTYILN